jgi:hypothetical protein
MGKTMNLQYWIDGDDTADKRQLVVLTPEAVYADRYEKAALDGAVRELESGKSPATLFGKDATHVPLRNLTRVQIDENDEDIDFTWREGDKSQTSAIGFSGRAPRDTLFAKLQAHMQGTLQHGRDEVSRVRAAVGPLTGLTVLSLLTWVCFNAATAVRAAGEIEAEGRKKGLKLLILNVLDVLGPIGVSVIGGMLLALTAWYLYAKVSQPPRLQVLQDKPFRPAGPIVTSLKYLALFAVWFLALRAAI